MDHLTLIIPLDTVFEFEISTRDLDEKQQQEFDSKYIDTIVFKLLSTQVITADLMREECQLLLNFLTQKEGGIFQVVAFQYKFEESNSNENSN